LTASGAVNNLIFYVVFCPIHNEHLSTTTAETPNPQNLSACLALLSVH
jgi:hypothetical protein